MRYFAATLFLLLVTLPARPAVFDCAVPPRPQDKFKSAAFRLWVPDGVKTIRAIIVHQHGCGRNGITNATDAQWQALALKHDAALMGTTFTHAKECTEWHDPANGSSDAFLAALKTFATDSKHPELETAPWALWGHSGGAYWAVDMTARFPDRVVAAFPRSGGRVSAAPAGTPVMFQLGAKEEADRFAKLFATAAQAYAEGRGRDAAWSWAVDPKASHDTRNSRSLAIPFFDACLAQRLPADGGAKLRPMDATKAWLGDPKTFDVAPAAEFKGDRAKAAWLPNEAVAKAWKEFVTTGDVADTTPPPAPTDVRAAADAKGVNLTWDLVADLESGIASFNVYRGSEKIGSVAGQKSNYGDEPEPAVAVTSLVTPVVDAGRPVSYFVTAVNRAGLESEKSAAAK